MRHTTAHLLLAGASLLAASNAMAQQTPPAETAPAPSPQDDAAPSAEGEIVVVGTNIRGARVTDIEFRVGSRGGRPGGSTPDSLVPIMAKRVGLEKRGDRYALYVSLEGEPMHQFGAPITQPIAAPFYVGIGFCSHLPDTVDTARVSDVVLENAAGRIR